MEKRKRGRGWGGWGVGKGTGKSMRTRLSKLPLANYSLVSPRYCKSDRTGYALQCASEKLRNDREVVLRAVSTTGCALDFASLDLRKDRDIVMRAVSKNGASLRSASEAYYTSKRERDETNQEEA